MIINKDILNIGKKFLNDNDFSFFKRVWSQDLNIYKDRLSSIDFNQKNNVLDAGCGFGQWSLQLSILNNNIYAIDNDHTRINILKELKKLKSIENIHENVGNIQNLEFENNFFDALFCYSSIYFSDVSKTLDEFYRVLKPNGIIYISTNDIGWYFHNLIDGHNSDKYFNSKKMALKTIENSVKYYSLGTKEKGQIITPKIFMKNKMKEIGFKNIRIGSDGTLNNNKIKVKKFYPTSYDFGVIFDGVYEILAAK